MLALSGGPVNSLVPRVRHGGIVLFFLVRNLCRGQMLLAFVQEGILATVPILFQALEISHGCIEEPADCLALANQDILTEGV